MREKKKALRTAIRAALVSATTSPSLCEGTPPSQGGELPRTRETPLRAKGGWQPEADGVVNLVDRIESLPEFAAAHTVALYCSLPDEVPTAEILHRWLGIKRLALPVVGIDHPVSPPGRHPSTGGEPPTLSMSFREYTGEGCLVSGAFSIDEPHAGREIPAAEIDLMLVPGVAFDAAGRRLGRGGGFYDRYLSQPAAAHIYKVGLCRPGALVAEVPAEPHDVVMDKVITF